MQRCHCARIPDGSYYFGTLNFKTKAFPDSFHLKSLELLLVAISQLAPVTNIKQMVALLIERVIIAVALLEEDFKANATESEKAEEGVDRRRAILDELKLFEIFWREIKEIITVLL